MRSNIDLCYNLDYTTYAFYYLDYLAVAASLLNFIYLDETRTEDKEEALLICKLNSLLVKSMALTSQVLEKVGNKHIKPEQKNAFINALADRG